MTPAHARFLALCGFALLALAWSAAPARAEFRACNNTASRVGVALGYNDGKGWLTEGWFNMRPGQCETLLKGDLGASFYYVYAVDYDHGSEWGGTSFMCTRDREFSIRGNQDCLARGYDRTGFFEINTGQQHSWTVEINDNSKTGVK